MPSEGASCSNCSAPLVADQRYCLSCGQPSSPVRLAFLDVLQAEQQAMVASPIGPGPVTYAGTHEPEGLPVPMRRYAPLFGVLSVLLLAMIIGLLVGHWATQGNAPAKQVVEVKGLGGAPLAAAASSAPAAPRPTASAPSSANPKSEAAELATEAKTPAPPPAKPVKVSATGLKKLGSSTGKKHQEEVAKLGNKPIETGGGSSTPALREKSIGGGSSVTSIE
ncbi:MAG TPA: zinc ribbon domain-containing protein [Solirubrobacteraceae bacterium]|nr:zinc ribbon domain-containing protein [Solirubrobacteraceae bacterium]